MNCPSDDVLRSLLLDWRSVTDSAEMLQHVQRCAECQTRVDNWGENTRLSEVLNRVPDLTSTGNSDDRVADTSGIDGPGQPQGPETLTYHQRPLRRLGNYDLLHRIGKGGGGEVYEAFHTKLCCKVAIKILNPDFVAHEHARRRFLREMESIGGLAHPHIVTARDAGDIDGTLYLAMELVDGPDLESLARRVSPMSIPDACELIRQAALGLQHIFENGLVHRDLKPSNLLLSPTGVKITDLGLALLGSSQDSDERLTGTCVIMGTGDYMAPEQAEGARNLDIRADLYSLGCTLFRLIAGRPPYSEVGNGSAMKKLMAHVRQPIPDVSRLRPETPPELQVILEKLLAKDRSDRFKSPRELATALEPFCRGANLDLLLLQLSTDSKELPRLPANDRDLSDQSVFGRSPGSQPSTEPIVELRTPRKLNWQRAALLAGVVAVVARQDNAEDVPVVRPPLNVQKTALVPPDDPVPAKVPARENPAPPIVFVAPPVAPPVLGPIAERWKREFGSVPEEILLFGQPGFGAARVDEAIRALTVQTLESRRFVKLGGIMPRPGMYKLSLDIKPQGPAAVRFGFFFGFNPDNADQPQFMKYQALEIRQSHMPPKPPHKYWIVRRYEIEDDLHGGFKSLNKNCEHDVQVPHDLSTLSCEVNIVDGALVSVLFCGQVCENICHPGTNKSFALPLDNFGVFVSNGSVWFTNPQFRKVLP